MKYLPSKPTPSGRNLLFDYVAESKQMSKSFGNIRWGGVTPFLEETPEIFGLLKCGAPSLRPLSSLVVFLLLVSG